jgi:hypothetical protein
MSRLKATAGFGAKGALNRAGNCGFWRDSKLFAASTLSVCKSAIMRGKQALEALVLTQNQQLM